MAMLTLTNVYFEFDSVNFSDYIDSLTFQVEQDLHDASSVTDEWAEALPGLSSGTINLVLYQDFASGKVDDKFWTAFTTKTAGKTAKIVPNSDDGLDEGPNNPAYEFTCWVKSYPILAGSHGELAKTQIALQITGAVTRDATA